MPYFDIPVKEIDAMSNPLLTTLYLIRECENPATAEELRERLDVSDRTLKRMIVEAKELGADLQSCRIEGGYYWVCRNWDQLQRRGLLARWIELEESRSLV